MTLTLYLCSLAVFWHTQPLQKHRDKLSTQGCAEPFCSGLLLQASASCSSSQWCLFLSCTSLEVGPEALMVPEFLPVQPNRCRMWNIVQTQDKLLQIDGFIVCLVGFCNCSCIGSSSVGPVRFCRVRVLFDKLTHGFFYSVHIAVKMKFQAKVLNFVLQTLRANM